MDFVVEFLETHLLLLYFAGLFIAILKIIFLIRFAGFNFNEYILSFFTFYNMDEIECENMKERVSYMKWNNIMNSLFYLWIFVIIFYRVVTINAHII